MVAFVRYADRAGLRAPVPTCPDWTVRDLVGPPGHGAPLGAPRCCAESPTDAGRARGEGRGRATRWSGCATARIELVEALTRSPADVRAPVFLDDAPAPREFWARRQCHETTVHAVDALAAALGRPPDPAETWIETDLAVDGIDELLGGFADPADLTAALRRGRRAGRGARRRTRLVAGPGRPAARRSPSGGPVRARPARTGCSAGTAVDLYLSLWNRVRRDR